jgi:hypothetical protein
MGVAHGFVDQCDADDAEPTAVERLPVPELVVSPAELFVDLLRLMVDLDAALRLELIVAPSRSLQDYLRAEVRNVNRGKIMKKIRVIKETSDR